MDIINRYVCTFSVYLNDGGVVNNIYIFLPVRVVQILVVEYGHYTGMFLAYLFTS